MSNPVFNAESNTQENHKIVSDSLKRIYIPWVNEQSLWRKNLSTHLFSSFSNFNQENTELPNNNMNNSNNNNAMNIKEAIIRDNQFEYSKTPDSDLANLKEKMTSSLSLIKPNILDLDVVTEQALRVENDTDLDISVPIVSSFKIINNDALKRD